MSFTVESEIVRLIEHAPRSVCLFLDFDGTLVPIQPNPQDTQIEASTKELLRRLSKHSQLSIISGRTKDFLETQFEVESWVLGAEHGGFARPAHGSEWRLLSLPAGTDYLAVARRVMEEVSSKVPDSFIEQKNFSVAWHYRNAPEDLQELGSQELVDRLTQELQGEPVKIGFGKKVVEVRPLSFNKGLFVTWVLENLNPVDTPIVIAIGDDETDEAMFSVVNEQGGISIKVGGGESLAPYRLSGSGEVISLLKEICGLIR